MPTDDLRAHAEKILPLLGNVSAREKAAVAIICGWEAMYVHRDRGSIVFLRHPDDPIGCANFPSGPVTAARDWQRLVDERSPWPPLFTDGGLEQAMRERGYLLVAEQREEGGTFRPLAGWHEHDDEVITVTWQPVIDGDWPRAWVRAAIQAVGLVDLVYRGGGPGHHRG